MKASDLMVKNLVERGVEFVFGIPGEENLDLLESLKHSPIKLIVTRHEQAAGFMAATVGRLSGKPGVCLSTLGPGATNFTTPAAYAQLGAMPMLMITGQKPIKSSKQGKFQIVDVVAMMKPLTNYAAQIRNADDIPQMMYDAFVAAGSERPGAVHLELPEDIAHEETEREIIKDFRLQEFGFDEENYAKALAMIREAKFPLLLIGAGCQRHNLPELVRQFVDKTGMYFITSQMAKGVVSEDHPQFIGTTALSATDFVHCASDKADLIVALGHDVIEKPPFLPKDGQPRIIHINYHRSSDEVVYNPELMVVGDLVKTVAKMTADLEDLNRDGNGDFSYFQKIKEEVDKNVVRDFGSDAFPLLPQRVVADVRATMPKDGIVCLDNGMYKLWFARHYKTYLPNTILLDNALATMGAGLPSAMAAKLVYPERKVIAVAGDGGFMMNSQELETAVRLGLDLVVLIICDDGYGMIKWKQKDMGFADYGLDFGNPNFVAYAESYGAKGYSVENCADFKPLLARCLDEKGVHVIRVPVDYSENQKVFSRELKEKKCPVEL